MPYKIGTNKIEYEEDGKIMGTVEFPVNYLDTVCITSTHVDHSLRGRGIAARLLELTAEELRKTNRKAVPECSYAVKWFEQNTQYSDILEKK
jgi:predicted GNAT family acetyltransferase